MLGTQLTVDAKGDAMMGGYYHGTVNIGAGPFDSQGSRDLFLTGYAPNGTFKWAKSLPIALEGAFTGTGVTQLGLDDVTARSSPEACSTARWSRTDNLLINSVPELTDHQDLFLAGFIAPCMLASCADTTPPVVGQEADGFITVPPDMIVEAKGPSGAPAWWVMPTVVDNESDGTTVACDPVPGSMFPLGANTVNCKGYDAHGNVSAPKSFKVTVVDRLAPQIKFTENPLTVTATQVSGIQVTFPNPVGQATDQVSGDVTNSLSCTPPSGTKFPVGTNTATCSAHDAAGNFALADLTVIVNPPPDSTPPVLHGAPQSFTVEATSASGATATYTKPTATDAVDPNPTVSCSPASGTTFALGATNVTCTASDATGNTASASFTITVKDTKAPVLAGVPQSFTLEATSGSGAIATYATPTASDTVDPNVTAICAPASGTTFALGTTTVNCSAKDASNNSASASFTITVHDTTAPAISGVPSNQTLEATSASGAIATYTKPTATDAVSGSINVNCTPASGSAFALGTTTVNCSATDVAGNSASASFTITVKDTTAPAISAVPSNQTLEATSAAGAIATYTKPTATDAVSGSINVNCSPASGTTFALGTTTVNCSATDVAGNSASASFTVTVRDTTAPVLSAMPANQTLVATSASGATATYTTPTATDKVNGSVPVTCAPASGSLFALGTTTVTCTAKDTAGNTAKGTFTITVQFSWSGFNSPLANPDSKSFNQGSNIPVKFQLTGASAPITNAYVVLSWTKLSGSNAGAGSSVVLFDKNNNSYSYGLNTTPMAKGNWKLALTLYTSSNVLVSDGVDRSVTITIK